MSDTQVGGNGSVHWLVRPDSVAPDGQGLMKVQMKDGRWLQHGVDYKGKSKERGETLKVRIKLPPGADLDKWRAVSRLVTKGGDTIAEIELALENDPDTAHTQVQIAWGGSHADWEDTLASLPDQLNKIGGRQDDLRKA